MTPMRLLVVDDHTVFRRGLVSLLQDVAEFAVVGQAADWEQALRLSGELQPDGVLVDVKVLGMDAARATRRLLETTPHAQVLMLTVSDDDRDLLAALGAGAHGYVLKDAHADTFLEAVRQIHADEAMPAPTWRNEEEHTLMAEQARRATALERIIGVLPVPYAVSAGLFATVLGPPGTIALGFLVTGSWAATADLYFGGMPPAAAWQQTVAVLVWWLTYFVIHWAVRWERLAIAREDEALRELIPAGVGPPWVTRHQSATWPAALVAALLVVVSWPFVIAVLAGLEGAHQPVLAALWVAQNVLRLGLFFLGLGTSFWLTAAALLGLMWLGRQPLKLKPLEDDSQLGLRPAGSMALISASTYIGIVSLLALQLALAPAIGPFGPALAVSTVFGVGLFFAPLWGLHRKMLARKEERQAEVRSRLLRLAFAPEPLAGPAGLPGDPAAAFELADLKDQLARATEVLALEAAGRKIDASATWPFDLAILQRLGGAVMLPIVIALLTELVRQVLGL